MPKLSELTPQVVAEAVVDRLLAHIGRQAMRLAPALNICWADVPTAEVAAGSDLGMTAQDLTRWAQTGEGPADEAWDALQSLCEALFVRPGDAGTYEVPAIDREDVDADDPIGLVILATLARRRLMDGEPLSPRELGALASTSDGWIRQQIGAGDLSATKEAGKYLRIPAEDARRWLAARGVPGV